MLKLPFSFRKIFFTLGGVACALSAGFFLLTSYLDSNAESSTSGDILFEDPDPSDAAAEFRFLNTQTDPSLAERYSGNVADIIRTKDDKYILIDTGDSDPAIRDMIKSTLRDYQSTSGNVTLDFLIVSHLDSDHVGNAAALISDPEILVKNVVIKEEGAVIAVEAKRKNFYDGVVSAVFAENATLYTNAVSYEVDGVAIRDYAKYSRITEEGVGNSVIPVGNYLTLYLYNTRDVFHNKTCEKGYGNHWTTDLTDPTILKDSAGRYQVLDNTSGTYPNISPSFTTTLENSGTGFNQLFYHTASSSAIYSCRSNPNSIGVLVGVQTSAGEKFAYFPGDMDNWGYDFLPETTDVTYYSYQQGATVTKPNHKIYGNGIGILYKNNTADDVYNNNVIENNNKTYSETKVALEIADRLGNNKDDLVLYQLAHHGANNDPDAIEILGLNRSSGIYAVNNRANNIATRTRIDFLRTYYYTLGKIPDSRKLYTGHKDGDGVYCIITESGESKCSYSPVVLVTLSYNLNGGIGTQVPESCLREGTPASCDLTIPSSAPTRSGYSFLGWADSADATASTYSPGDSVTLTADKMIYAVWKADSTNPDPGTTDPTEPDPSDPTDPGTTDPDPGTTSPTLSDLITNTTTATVSISSSDAFVVSSSTPCAVLLSSDGGNTFSRLSSSPVSGQPDSRSYTIPNLSSSVSITIAYAGDVNQDSSVNVRDVRKIINSVLGTETLSSAQSLLADVNADNSINVRDARAIINSVLGNTSLTW